MLHCEGGHPLDSIEHASTPRSNTGKNHRTYTYPVSQKRSMWNHAHCPEQSEPDWTASHIWSSYTNWTVRKKHAFFCVTVSKRTINRAGIAKSSCFFGISNGFGQTASNCQCKKGRRAWPSCGSNLEFSAPIRAKKASFALLHLR